MRSALIGHTGFVGSNLSQQFTFTDLYNSQNIADISGKTYDLIVCAAAPGIKWKANQNPEADKASIDNLIKHLGEVNASECILISTVDVYPVISGVNEFTPINKTLLQPYGLHRLELEEFVTKQFKTSVICRLPALFGPGLKKNFIFDLIHDAKKLQFTHPESQFQFYDLSQLWHDLQLIRNHKIPLINLVTEPIRAKDIATAVYQAAWKPGENAQPVFYNLTTQHAALFENSGNYIANIAEVLPKLIDFITTQYQLVRKAS